MGLLDNGLKGNVMTGLAIGIGAAILAPAVIPVVANVAKPLLKAAIKTGIIMFEKGKETVAELNEVFEDIVAEAKAEVAEAHNPSEQAASFAEGETGA
jgi:peptide subunit release factor 1 (eRF1)